MKSTFMGSADTDTSQLSRNADEIAELLKLMAHPLRMRVLCRIAQGECTVGEIVDQCEAPQPAVSQILAKMKSEGLVHARRDGKFIHYSIQDPRVGKLMKSFKKIFCEETKN